MFDEEREMWEKFFGYFKGKFGEDVGILPGAFEDDDMEIDMMIGEESKLIRGIRVFQIMEDEEAEGEEEEEEEVDVENEEEEENDDEDDEGVGINVYDLIFTPGAKVKGTSVLEVVFPEPEKIDEPECEHGEGETCEHCTPHECDHGEDETCEHCEEPQCDHGEDETCEKCNPEIPEDKIWATMEIFTEDGEIDSEITCAVVTYKGKDEKCVFIESEDFPDI